MVTLIMSLQDIQDQAIAMHNAHYARSPTGLIRPNDAPNDNTIYKLYNDGQLNYTKGGFAYGQRSEFEWGAPILRQHEASAVKFPKKVPGTDNTFCELLQGEADHIRALMKEYVKARI